MFILKLTKTFTDLHTWSVSRGILFTPMYSSEKKLQKTCDIMWMDVYNTGLHFMTFFKSEESELTFMIVFFLLNTRHQSHFFLSRPAFPKFYAQSPKRIISVGIFRWWLLYVLWSFSIFLGSQGGSNGIVRDQMKFISFYAVLFNFFLLLFVTVILIGKLAYVCIALELFVIFSIINN